MKKIISLLLAFTLAIPVIANASDEQIDYDDFWDGMTKTEVELVENEYVITEASQLAWIAEAVNNGEITGEDTIIRLEANINFNEYEWSPIGTPEHPFMGSFDGNNHYIKGLSPDKSANYYSGLFGVIEVPSNTTSTISNINIVDTRIKLSAGYIDNPRIGSIAGEIKIHDGAELKIENSKLGGSLYSQGNAIAGGLVGRIQADINSKIEIENIETNVDVNASNTILSHAITGGLIGEVSSESTDLSNSIFISRCKIDANLKASSPRGGNTADTGGLIGVLAAEKIVIDECMVAGTMYAEAELATVSGIVSSIQFNQLELSNSVVTADFSTNAIINNLMGGLLGYCECTGDLNNSNIVNCYVNGSADVHMTAGFIIRNKQQDKCINIKSSFFDNEKLNIDKDKKVSYRASFSEVWIDSDNIATSFGLTTEEMQFSQYFLGWDFDNVWTWDETGYPVLRFFNKSHENERVSETLVDRVKKYVSDFSQEDIDAIINGNGTDIEKANAIVELLNRMEESMGENQAFSTLTSNNLYASYLMMDRLRSTQNGTLARIFIGLNGLIYGELLEHITNNDPAYRKYRTLLSSFMKESREEFELFSYISTTSSFLSDIEAKLEEKGILDNEFSDIILEIQNANSISEVNQSLEKLNGSYTIATYELKSASLEDLFSFLGNTATFADITSESIQEISSLGSDIECYHQYQDFLSFIENNDNFPSQMRAAARDLNKSYEEQYLDAKKQYIRQVSKWALENEIDLLQNIVFDKVLVGSFAQMFSKSIPGINWGIVIVDGFLNMSEFVDSATYVEGYGMLQEEYTRKLLDDKERFLVDPSENNAKQFYRDYTLLWNLRDKGEKMFLKFIGYDGTWSGSIRQKLNSSINYNELRQVTNISRNYLEHSAFTFEDIVAIKSDSILEFDQTVVVDCPVDIYVYDEYESALLGKIEDGQCCMFDENAFLSLWTDGEQKVINMPKEMEYVIEVVAREEGEMNYYTNIKLNKLDQTYINRFMNIALEKDFVFKSDAASQYRVLELQSKEDEVLIKPTEELWLEDSDKNYIDIDVSISGDGEIYGSGKYLKGSYVLLTVADNKNFDGWYQDGKLISNNETLGFVSFENNLIEAKFYEKSGGNNSNIEAEGESKDTTESLKEYTITVSEEMNGKVILDAQKYHSGAYVPVMCVPDTGFVLEELIVMSVDGIKIELQQQQNGKLAFVMPNSDVTIQAKFAKKQEYRLPFIDIFETDWYYDSVFYVYNKNLMAGGDNLQFMPSQNLTRAMAAQILYNMEGKPQVGNNPFVDVPEDSWYEKAVSWAASQNIVAGVGENRFHPESDITREQFVTILYRYAQMKGYDITEKADLYAYVDLYSISEYAKDAVQWSNAKGIMNGMTENTLNPQGVASRAQVATMLMNFDKTFAL